MKAETKKENELLIRRIQEEPCYRQYLRLCERIAGQEELKQKLDHFRRENRDYHRNGGSQQQYSYLMELHRELAEIPEARAFLEAESQVCRLYRELLKTWETFLQIPEI